MILTYFYILRLSLKEFGIEHGAAKLIAVW